MPITFFGKASNPADNGSSALTQITVTPPASMQVGDLVVVLLHQRGTATFSVGVTGGQSWNSLTRGTNTNLAIQYFWCRFNGTWSADPRFDFSAGTCSSAIMHVFRPSSTSNDWALSFQTFSGAGAPSSPNFTLDNWSGQTISQSSGVAIAGWHSTDDNTWGSLSGTGWALTGTAQFRNTAGQDQSSAIAWWIGTGSVPQPSLNQTTLGGDAGAITMIAFYEFAGPQTLTAPLLSDGDTFNAHTIAPQAVAITAPLFTNSPVLYAPTITQPAPSQNLTAPQIDDSTDTFYSHTVTTGAVTVTAPLFTNSNTQYNPSLAPQPVAITAPLFTNSPVLYEPTILPVQSLTAPQIGSGSNLFAITVAPGAVAAALPVFTNTSVLYAPVAAPQAISATLPLLSDGDTLFAPTAAAGAVSLALPAIAATSAPFAPSVAAGAVSVALPLFTNNSTLFTPSLVAGQTNVSLPQLANAQLFYGPTVAGGATGAFLPLISDGDTLFEPALIAGPVAVATPVLINVSDLRPGALLYNIAMPSLPSGTLLFAPAIPGDGTLLYAYVNGQFVPGILKGYSNGSWHSAKVYQGGQWQ